MSRYTNGSELILYVDGVILGASKSHSISYAATTIDTSNKEDGIWEDSEPGRLSYSIKADALVAYATGTTSGQTNFDTLYTKFENRETVSVISKRNTVDGSGVYTGTCMIETLDLTANHGEMATFSISLKGKGEMVKS